MNCKSTISLIAVLFSTAASFAQPMHQNQGVLAAGEAVYQLFEHVDPTTVAPQPATPRAYTAVGLVRVRADLLTELTRGKRVRLDPTSDQVWIVAEIRQPSPRIRVTRCSLPDDETACTVLVTVNGVTAMSQRIPRAGIVRRLQSINAEVYEVWALDHANLEPEECFLADDQPAVDRHTEPTSEHVSQDVPPTEAASAGCAATAIAVLDTMVVYTPAARTAIGGHSAMRAEATLAIELQNLALENSQASSRGRLVYCDEINYVEAVDPNGDSDLITDLNRLQGTADGFMDGVHQLRDDLNADLVAMFGDTGSGRGNCPAVPTYSRAFSVSNWTRAAATLTHAHEAGHNQGCGHDAANGSGCSASWSLGWRFIGNDGLQYRTVMAYSPGERIPYYSNPNVSYLGTPTGIPIGDPNEAYNVWTIEGNDSDVAAYELTRFDIYVDFDFNFIVELGTPTNPYDTLPEGIAAIDTPATGAAELPSLYVVAGTTDWTGTISKAMTVSACGGSVIIGTP